MSSRSSSNEDWDDWDEEDFCWLDDREVQPVRSRKSRSNSNKCHQQSTPRTAEKESAPFHPSSSGSPGPQLPIGLKTPPSGYALADWRRFRARLVALETQNGGMGQLFVPGVDEVVVKPDGGSERTEANLSKSPSPAPQSPSEPPRAPQSPSPAPLQVPSSPQVKKQSRPKKQPQAQGQTTTSSPARASPPPSGLRLGPSSWAHQITHPEAGCLLLAKGSPGEMAFFDRAVILVTSHDETRGSVGFVLNKPSPMRVSDLQLASECPGFIEAFGGQRLQIGGPAHLDHATVLHRFVGLSGSTQVSDRLFTGGLPDALKLVQAGLAKPHDFSLVLGMSGWGPRQLLNEVNNGMWHCVAASPDLVLPRKAPVSNVRAGDPHDTQTASAAAAAIKEGQDMWTRIMSIVAK